LTLSYSIDTASPIVTGISSPNPSGNYIIGDEVSVNLSFSEAVVVSGTPTLTLDAGTRDVVVNYVSGSGSSTLLFTYVVATGDLKNQLDVKATDSLALAGGSLTDRVGNAAVLTLPVPGSATSLVGSKSLSIDGVPPLKPMVLSAAGVDGITLDWTDNTESDLKEYRIYSCSGLVAANCSTPSAFTVLSSVVGGVSTFEHIAVGRGITYYYYVTAIDLRGNESPSSDVVSWILPVPVLVATPSVTVVSPTNDLTPEITGVADAGATVYVYMDGSSTALGSVTAAGNGTYSFSPPSNLVAGVHTFRARAIVSGVKTGSSGYSYEASVLIDTTAPTFSSNNRSVPTTQITGLDTLTFRLSFSEALSGLDASDFAVSGTTATVSRVAMASGSTGDYDITVSGGDLAGYNGVVGVRFVASPTVTDIAGNALAGTTPATTAQTYTMDNSNPPVTITSTALTLGGTSTATITFTLGQSSTDFVFGDVDVVGGTLSAFAGTGLVYTATFTPKSGYSGTATVSVDAGSFSNVSGVYNAAGSLSLTIDTTAPNIISLQSTTTNGIYTVGAIINVTVTFDEAVSVGTGGGVPSLLLETGATDRTASYVSGSGASILTFRYVVQAGDLTPDLDVQSGAALVLNGGTIRDLSGNAGNTALMVSGATGSLGANAAIVIDTIAPSAPTALSAIGVGGVTTLNRLTATNTDMGATATITAGEATGGSATLYLDGVAIATDSTILVGDTSVSFALGKTTVTQLQTAVTAGGSLTVKLTDLAGNNSNASASVALIVDYVVPTIQLMSSRTTLIAGQTATMTATLSESSVNFTSADVTVAGGTISGFTGSGTSYTFTFTPTTSSTTSMSISVAGGVFSDAVGNLNTASSAVTATVDTLIPIVSSLTSPTVNGAYRAGTTIDIAVTLSENVVVTTGGGVPTLLLETGATYRAVSYVSGSGTSILTFRYVVQAGDTSSDLDAQSASALVLNGGTIKDVAGNDAGLIVPIASASGSLATSKAIVIDTTAPSAPTALATTPVGGIVVANTLLSASTNMTATASIVAGQATGGSAELILGTITIATDTTISAGDTSLNFNLNFSTSAELQAAIAAGGQLSVRLIDAAGNISSSSQAVTLTVDYVKPSVSMTASSSTLKIGQTSTLTVVLSEPSSTFVLGDMTVSGGTVGTFVVVSPTQYTLVFTPTTAVNGGTGTLSIAGGAFTDTAGNLNIASSTLSISYDTAAPSVPGVNGTSPILTNDATPTLSGTAEMGATVYVTDSSTTPATQLASLVATNGTWSFDAATLSEGDHFISAVAVDAAGNTSASSTAKTWRIDTTPPTVSLSTVAGNDVVVRSEKDSGVVISGAVEIGASVSLQFAGLTMSIAPSNGSWTYSLTASDWTTIGSTSPIVFSVTATDAANNTASRTRSVTMNLVNIAVPGDPDLNAADDTLNNADNITTQRIVRIDVPLVNNATPSHEAGQLLELIDDTGFVMASRILDATDVAAATYQFTLRDLNDDVYGVKSRVTSLGNSAGSLGQLNLVVDNRVPGTPGAPNMTDATDTGISARDNVTSTLRPIFKVAIDGIEISGSPLVAGDSILLLGGSTIVETLTLSSSDISTGFVLLQPNIDLSEGSNSLTAKARSIAGVSGSDSIALSVLIDTTGQIAPSIPDLIATDDTGVSSSDNTTSIVQPRLSVLLSGLGVVANDQIQLLDASLRIIGSVTVSSIDVANGYVYVLPLEVLVDGSQVLKVRVLDRAGNIGQVSSGLTLKIVTSVPNATEPTMQTSSDSGRSSSDRITLRTTPTFVGTGTSGDTVQLYDGLQLIGTGQVVGGNWSITVSALADNSYTLRALVIDSAGNASSFSAGLGVTIDTSRPIAPVITGSNLLKSTATPTISGTAEALAVVSLYEGLHLIGTTTADSAGNWSLTTSSLVDRSYSLKASATDIAGNTSTDSTTVNMLVDTVAPNAPTINAITTFALAQPLTGTGEPGATLSIYDGANVIGTVTVPVGGSWTFTTLTLSNSSHSFTAVQVDSVGNTSVASSPARTIPAIQFSALYGANGLDDDGIAATASQYGAGGITDIDNAAKATLINDVIDKLASTAVDTQAEIIALAVVVKKIFDTAAGGNPVPALTPEDLALLGITGVDQDSLSSVISAIAGTADNGSGIDSLAELTALVDAALAAQRAAFAIISVYDGTNAVPAEADFASVSVTGVNQTNLSSVNTVLEVLNAAATDSRSEVQAIVDTYTTILNGADGVSNSAISLTFTQYRALGLTAITTSAQASLLSSILDARARNDVDTYVELQAIASVVARLAAIAAGGVASPALTPEDFALIGVTGVTTSNLAAVIAAIAATTDNGSGIDSLAKLQANVDAGISAARGASLAIISNYSGSNAAPGLSDFENAGVIGVDSSNITAINTFIAYKSAADTDSQAEVQALVDAYAKVVALANGAADGGVPLTATEFSSLGLPDVDTPAEVNLLNELIDIRPTTAVDSYQELAALASIVTRFIGEAGGTAAVPALTPADFAALGLSGVTDANLAEVLAAIRASGADGSGIDSLSELRSIVDGAVAQSRLNAIDRISRYDGTGATVVPTLNDFANAGVTGVTTNNLSSINSAFAVIGMTDSDTTNEIQNIVSGYVAILNGADGISDNDIVLTQVQYVAMGLTRIDTAAKSGLLNEIFDRFALVKVDTYPELQAVSDVVADIFLVAIGGQAQTALSIERLASIGITGVTTENLALIVQAIANSADDTTGVDSLSEIQAIVNQVRADQASALGVISGYDGTNTVPSLNTFASAGIIGVDASNIGIINQFLAIMPAGSTDSVAEVQALVDAVLKLMICADGTANGNCTFTAAEFQAMGYTDIDTQEEVDALNADLDVLDLTPNEESRKTTETVNAVIERFRPQPVPTTTPPTTSPATTAPVTTPATTVPAAPSPVTTVPELPATTAPTSTVPATTTTTTTTTTLPALDLLPESNGVKTAPGQAVVVIDGVVTDLIVTINEDNSATIEYPGNFIVRIIPINPNDGAVLADGASGLRVYRDRTVSIQGEGFAPATEVEVWINSTPIKLGTALTDSNGAFSQTFDVPPGIELGEHTLTLSGNLVDGTLGRASIGLVVVDVDVDEVVPPPTDDGASGSDGSSTGGGGTSGDNPGGEPYDPMSEPKSVISLLGDMAGLMALAGIAVAGRRREEKSDDDGDDESDSGSSKRGSGDISDVAVKHHSVSTDSADDILRMPKSSMLDRIVTALPVKLARFSPMVGRVFTDGTYLRSLLGLTWIIMPVLGIIGGIGSAMSTDFNAVMPSFAWLILIVVIGTFDALAGFLAASTFGLLIVLGGGINSADSIRGLLGIWVFSFAVPMLASASRPFRRKDAVGIAGMWDRTADFVMIVLFGAWAAGSMFGALPGLTGFRPSYAGDVSRIQIIVLIVLIARYVLENVSVILTPGRMLELSHAELPDPSGAQVLISALFRTASFTFVAVVFIGNNWALWTGAALYLLPKLVTIVDDNLPNSEALHRYLPRGILKVTFMMLVARWWGQLLTSNIDDAEKMLTFGFVFLGLPGFITTVLGWFGRSSSQPWKQNWFTRIGGLILLVVGFLIVRGVLLG
ncbi:MAG: hypothetical protein F2738_02310, partial [Actinobacteria bacterium]|nr:hypothetical protein [Actinomycetota bacterium]